MATVLLLLFYPSEPIKWIHWYRQWTLKYLNLFPNVSNEPHQYLIGPQWYPYNSLNRNVIKLNPNDTKTNPYYTSINLYNDLI